MTMRLEVGFPRPLTREDRTRFLLVVSALAATKRVTFIRGDQAALVTGEALAAATLRRVLTEESIPFETVVGQAEEPADPAADTGARERFRPIGR
jgi:hypothetical protein